MNRPHFGPSLGSVLGTSGLLGALLSVLALGPAIVVAGRDVAARNEYLPSLDDISAVWPPRRPVSRRFIEQQPRPQGDFIRVLPALAPEHSHVGSARNRGQIRALGLGRKRLMNRPGIALSMKLDRKRRENDRRRDLEIRAELSYRNRLRLSQSFD